MNTNKIELNQNDNRIINRKIAEMIIELNLTISAKSPQQKIISYILLKSFIDKKLDSLISTINESQNKKILEYSGLVFYRGSKNKEENQDYITDDFIIEKEDLHRQIGGMYAEEANKGERCKECFYKEGHSKYCPNKERV